MSEAEAGQEITKFGGEIYRHHENDIQQMSNEETKEKYEKKTEWGEHYNSVHKQGWNIPVPDQSKGPHRSNFQAENVIKLMPYPIFTDNQTKECINNKKKQRKHQVQLRKTRTIQGTSEQWDMYKSIDKLLPERNWLRRKPQGPERRNKDDSKNAKSNIGRFGQLP